MQEWILSFLTSQMSTVPTWRHQTALHALHVLQYISNA